MYTAKVSEKEVRAVGMIRKALKIIILVLVLIMSVSLLYGRYTSLNEKIAAYENEVSGRYVFSNIEILRFLTTDGVKNFRKQVEFALDSAQISDVKTITILDSISKEDQQDYYEWLIACDDKAHTQFICTYSGDMNSVEGDMNSSISVGPFEPVQHSSATSEQAESISLSAQDDTQEYISGTISNIELIQPRISGQNYLYDNIPQQICDTMSQKMLEFLVETQNNRRSFYISQSGIRKAGDIVMFSIKPETTIGENDSISCKYSISNNSFMFEYTD